MDGVLIPSQNIQKDLFFSGHTSFMFLCFLQSPSTNIYVRCMYFGAVVLMAVMLLLNRVHYTIDVFVAPLIVYAIHCFVNRHLVDWVFRVDDFLMGFFKLVPIRS